MIINKKISMSLITKLLMDIMKVYMKYCTNMIIYLKKLIIPITKNTNV